MKSTYSIAQGQNAFPKLIRQAEKDGLAVVTRHDEAVAYVVSREKMESLLETMELLANPDFTRVLHQDRAGKLAYKPLSSLDDA
jgi:prevent-host-death family protein